MNKVDLILELVELHIKRWHLNQDLEERIRLYKTIEDHLKHIEYDNTETKFQIYNKMVDYVFSKSMSE